MVNSIIMADLERALQLLRQVDESELEFSPDPNVSSDIKELTGVLEYPTKTHLENLKARNISSDIFLTIFLTQDADVLFSCTWITDYR